MSGKLPMDIILGEYPPPLPLHPDDVAEGAESADDRTPRRHFPEGQSRTIGTPA
jgi:hypothetical protein